MLPFNRIVAIFAMFCLWINVSSAQPQIDSMMADENRDQLLIYGSFGNEEGIVTIDNSPQSIIRWTPYWIRTSLPASGLGSAGAVHVITADGSTPASHLSRYSFELLFEYIGERHPVGGYRNWYSWFCSVRLDLSRVHAGSVAITPARFSSNVKAHYYMGFYPARNYSSIRESATEISWVDSTRVPFGGSHITCNFGRSSIFLRVRLDTNRSYSSVIEQGSDGRGNIETTRTTDVRHEKIDTVLSIRLDDTLRIVDTTIVYGPASYDEVSTTIYTYTVNPALRATISNSKLEFAPPAQHSRVSPSSSGSDTFDAWTLFSQRGESSLASLRIYDVHGRSVLNSASNNEEEIRHLPIGVYLCVVTERNITKTFKLFKSY